MKKIIRIAFVTAIVAVAGYGVYTSQREKIEMSDVALANVEALASGESSEQGTLYGTPDGSKYCCCSGTRLCGAVRCYNC